MITRSQRKPRKKSQARFKKKQCRFKKEKIDPSVINYRNVELLKKYTMERGKIVPSRITGTSQKYQRLLARAIKRARAIGLLPYVVKD